MVHVVSLIVASVAVVYAAAFNDVRTFVLACCLIFWEVYLEKRNVGSDQR